jgi:hypothetical protein
LRVIKAGMFEDITLPVVQWEDGIAGLRFATAEGYKWKVNVIIINRLL